MSEYADLVKRLRGVAGQTLLLSYPAQTTPDPLSNEAADAIELLQRELKCANELWEQQKELALEYLADIEKANERIAELQQEVCLLIRRDPNDDLIERQAARINELEAAIKPFADASDRLHSGYDDGLFSDDRPTVSVFVSDLRQARKALGEKE